MDENDFKSNWKISIKIRVEAMVGSNQSVGTGSSAYRERMRERMRERGREKREREKEIEREGERKREN